MDDLTARIPGVTNTETWPAPFPLPEHHVWYGDDGVLVLCPTEGPTIESTDGRFQLPIMFEALVDRPNLPFCQLRIGVRPTGPACIRLVLGEREGESPPLTSSGIRIPLNKLVKELTLLIGGTDRQTNKYDRGGLERIFTDVARPAPGERLPDETYEQVARVYRYALQSGWRPTNAVAEALFVSRPTAGRYVVEARRRGLLGPALTGRAGEQPAPDNPDHVPGLHRHLSA